MEAMWAVLFLTFVVLVASRHLFNELCAIRLRLKAIHFVQTRIAGLDWTTDDAQSR